MKYITLWIIGLASAFGAHYAPVGQACAQGICPSAIEAFFACSMIGALLAIVGFAFSDLLS